MHTLTYTMFGGNIDNTVNTSSWHQAHGLCPMVPLQPPALSPLLTLVTPSRWLLEHTPFLSLWLKAETLTRSSSWQQDSHLLLLLAPQVRGAYTPSLTRVSGTKSTHASPPQ